MYTFAMTRLWHFLLGVFEHNTRKGVGGGGGAPPSPSPLPPLSGRPAQVLGLPDEGEGGRGRGECLYVAQDYGQLVWTLTCHCLWGGLWELPGDCLGTALALPRHCLGTA